MRHRWTATATEVFAKSKYAPDDQDVASLAESIALVEAAGLHALNRRLMQANRKVFDTIAELNVAAMLIRHLGKTTIEYEPADYGPRPVDFRIRRPDAGIHLQMKRFGELERDNRRDALYERIKKGAEEIRVGKFFGMSLTEEFTEYHIEDFLAFLARTAAAAADGRTHEFVNDGSVVASVEFWSPKSVALEYLTLGAAADANAVNITGLAANQLKASVRKAAAAFISPVDAQNLNLVIAESDKHHDIDICEACFGTEEELFSTDGRHAWHRLDDGVFREPGVVDTVAGLVVLRRLDPSRPMSSYEALLLINEQHVSWVEQICEVVPIARVVRYNMRP